jgi:hypothetical protein
MTFRNKRAQFTKIKGLSDEVSLPRLGKIRRGIKKVSERTGNEYPSETDYFVCPPEVQAIYGAEPKELDIIIPIEDENEFFPQALKAYTQTKLLCKGDGETASRLDTESNELAEIDCPCDWLDDGRCGQKANLMFMLPRVSMGGVYQLDTGSISTIVEINSSIKMIRTLCGRVSLVPLILKVTPREIIVDGKKTKKHFSQLLFTGNVDDVREIRDKGTLIALGPIDTGSLVARAGPITLPEPVEDGEEPTTPIPVEVEKDGYEPPETPVLASIETTDEEEGEMAVEMPHDEETQAKSDELETITEAQIKAIETVARLKKIDGDALRLFIATEYKQPDRGLGHDILAGLTKTEAADLLGVMQNDGIKKE